MSLEKEIYLDASSTTPIHSRVIKEVSNIMQLGLGNPSSIHQKGISASEVLEKSRSNISSFFNCLPEEIIFTSGATESIHLALVGACLTMSPGRIIISDIEHPAVVNTCLYLEELGWSLEKWPVTSKGKVDMRIIDEILSYPTKIVSMIWAQSEIGTIQPLEEIAIQCRDRGIILHTDASQIVTDNIIDWKKQKPFLLSASAHKFQGPKGIGLLLLRKNSKLSLRPIFPGGSQEFGIRPGTESPELAAGMAKALEVLTTEKYSYNTHQLDSYNYVKSLTHVLRTNLLRIPNLIFTGDEYTRKNGHISFVVSSNSGIPIPGRDIIRLLSEHGIYASSGTACNSGKTTDSSVLKAIGLPTKFCQSGIRLSIGPWLNHQDIEDASLIIRSAINKFTI